MIVESYRDFEPPPKFKRSVEILLSYVPQEYLVGLKTIVLTNRAALDRNQRRQKIWSRNRKVRLADCRGSHSRASKFSPATVWLYVDNIVQSEPEWLRWIPILSLVEVGEVLYHEIGHHIHTLHQPVYEGRENVAEDWSRRLWRRFLHTRYWYLTPLLYVLRIALKPFIKWFKKQNNL